MNPALNKSKYNLSPVAETQPSPVQAGLPLCGGLLPQREVPVMSRIPKYRVALVREKSISWHSRKFANSRHVFEFGRELIEGSDREQFWALMLDRKNSLIGVNLVAQGSLSETVVVPREVIKPAILLNSAALVVLHNHPSGDPTPSPEDRSCTARLTEACNVVGIRLLDHVIIGQSDYFSFTDAQMS